MLSLFLHHHLDTTWRRLHPEIPLLRYADDILLMCRTVTEARKAHDDLVELLRPTGMQIKGDRHSDVVNLTPERSAHWLGFRIEKRSKKSLAVLIDEKSWDGSAESLTESHDAPNAPVRAWLTIKGWVNDKGPCYKFANPNEVWERIASIAQAACFDEIPNRQKVQDWWQRAYARWCRLRKRYAPGVLGDASPAKAGG